MSFDKIETAAKAREIIGKVALKKIAETVPGKLIGRMMSVDLPRLKGTVWFPGDAQPTQISIFANAVPAEWQHKRPDFRGQDSSTEGWGCEVVVERLNGVLYVVQILSGGSGALDFKSLGISVMEQEAAPTAAGGPSADAIVDIAGSPYETFINCHIVDQTLAAKEAIEFGPFTSYDERTPDLGFLEVTVRVGTSLRTFEFVADLQELWDIDATGYTAEVWARLLPKQTHDTKYVPDPNDSFNGGYFNTDWDLDFCFRRTAYGNTANFGGYREMWFRIVKNNDITDLPGLDAHFTLRATNVQKGRSLGGRELFMMEKVHRPVTVSGHLGVNLAFAPLFGFDTLFNDNFGRAVSGGWGSGDSIYTSTWRNAGTATTTIVDGARGIIDIAAVNTNYEVLNDIAVTVSPDITFGVMCPTVATGASFRVGLVAFHIAASGNRDVFGLDFKTSGGLDLTARQRIAGTVTNIVAATSAGFTYSAFQLLKVRVWCHIINNTQIEVHMKVWPDDGRNEPSTWQKEFTYTPNGTFQGELGFHVFAETGNTNTKPVSIYFYEVKGKAVSQGDHGWTAGGKNMWATGPYRSAHLRLASDLQKTFTYKGSFRWDGTKLKLPEEIYFTGVGRNRLGLESGIAVFRVPASGFDAVAASPWDPNDIPNNFYTWFFDEGIPLLANQSLWLGMPPGKNTHNLVNNFFIVDSNQPYDFNLPEWAILIAVRGPAGATPEIRLGNGEHIALVSPWSTWSPTLSNLTQGSGIITARHSIVGMTVDYHFKFVMGTGSAVGSSPGFTLPAAPHASYQAGRDGMGRGILLDFNQSNRDSIARFISGSAVEIVTYGTTAAHAGITAVSPWTWSPTTNGGPDSLEVSGRYERA